MTNGQIKKWASLTGLTPWVGDFTPNELEKLRAFAELVRQNEREACAKAAEHSPAYDWCRCGCELVAAIRARAA
jgi:hypothetical protein